MDKTISIVVPCFNEQEALPIFFNEIIKVFGGLEYDWEILLVDDGSKDDTLAIMRDLSEKNKRIKYFSFSRNFGKESAMYAGFCNALGDYIVVMDADMQDPPDLLPQMIKILETKEYDSVATRRETRCGEPLIRSFFSRTFYKLINKISDPEIIDGARDFRLMKRDMVDAIIGMQEYNRFSKGIFGWIGFRTYWLPYQNIERVAGETKWSFWKLFKYAIDGIVNFSQIPLSVTSWLGIIMTVASFVALVFVIFRRVVFGDPVAGWASMICVIIFMGGIQLLCLGIMGQYIAKLYLEAKKRPHYIIRETNVETAKKCG